MNVASSYTTQKHKTRKQRSSDYNFLIKARGSLTLRKSWWQKLVVYGSSGDLYQYNNVRFSHSIKKHNIKLMDKERRKDAFARSRQMIFRLVEANIGHFGPFPPIFATLTFKENIKELKEANLYFKLFIKRLSYRLGVSLKYVCVPEFQKRGAVHYHIVFFNLPYIEMSVFQSVWGQGFTRVESVKKIKSVSAYLSKYLTKESFSSQRFYGEKVYFSSRGLVRPFSLFVDNSIERISRGAIIKKEYEGRVYNYKKLKLEKDYGKKLHFRWTQQRFF